MRGDPGLGAVLRQFRTSRRLSQEQVAARAPCAPSMVSQVETGRRVLHVDLAARLDQVYGTGTTIIGMVNERAYPGPGARATLDGGGILVRVELPHGGGTMVVPRRAVLAALSIGTTASALPDLHHALAKVPADEGLLAEQTQTLLALRVTGRVMAPTQVINSLVGQVTVLDVVRHRAPAHLRRGYLMLAAQYAESLSWMVQESGDLQGAASWVDRGQHWAEWVGWPDMVAYSHVKRSQLASTCAGDGRAAIRHATRALRLQASPTVQALAAKQIAYGHALIGRPDDCHRFLDRSVRLFDAASTQNEGPDPIIGLTNTGIDGHIMLAQFGATCDVYLGGGDRAITALSTYRNAYGANARRGGVNAARLARAYAQAGDPDHACALAQQALDTGQALDSATTRVELRRALGPLGRWPGREDVAEVRHRITALA
jgi:Helix-turn-helix domain